MVLIDGLDAASGHATLLALWLAWRDWRAAQQRPPAWCLSPVLLQPVLARPSAADIDIDTGTGTAADRLETAAISASRCSPRAALCLAWPPLTPDIHLLDFDADGLLLTLALGRSAEHLNALRLRADAVWLQVSGRDTATLQRLLKSAARSARPGADLGHDGRGAEAALLHPALQAAGFEPAAEAPSQCPYPCPCPYQYRPRPGVSTGAGPERPPARSAIVIGAGVAGAAVAQALAREGLQVTVLERHATAAAEASGNPAALVHGTVNRVDGPYARLFRAAALVAERCHGGQLQGLLRLQTDGSDVAAMRAVLAGLGLPPDHVQALDAAAASARAGVALSAPAWYYVGGGGVDPRAWVAQLLQAPGVTLRTGCPVASIEVRHRPQPQPQPQPQHLQHAQRPRWRALAADGSVHAEADVLVLCCPAQASTLLHSVWPQAAVLPWPLSATHGQVTALPGSATPGLRCAIAGDGYAMPLRDGRVLCGATRVDGTVADLDRPPPATAAADRHNLQRLERLTGTQGRAGLQPDAQGRAGWRLHTDDRLPLAGALPLWPLPEGLRADQARLLPRTPGLFALTALGARGLTLAPLLARLVAAQATGAPWPLPQDLADAVDPARWVVRAARHRAPPVLKP